MRSLLLALVSLFMLTGCGFDGSFRYPCQDPANWGNAECKPPICVTDGACPEDLVGEDVYNNTITTEEEVVEP